MQTVLGNHGYTCLAFGRAVKPKNHTLGDVLTAGCGFMATLQPLVIDLPEHMVVHAALDQVVDDARDWNEAIQRELTDWMDPHS